MSFSAFYIAVNHYPVLAACGIPPDVCLTLAVPTSDRFIIPRLTVTSDTRVSDLGLTQEQKQRQDIDLSSSVPHRRHQLAKCYDDNSLGQSHRSNSHSQLLDTTISFGDIFDYSWFVICSHYCVFVVSFI